MTESNSVLQNNMNISLIAAVDENNVIGSDGDIPWDYPEDLKHFRKTTIGHPVVMGRKTFDSITERIGGPLDKRLNIVLSTTVDGSEYDNVLVCGDIDESIQAAVQSDSDTMYVIGGESVYNQFIDISDELIITEIHSEHTGDTFFPDISLDVWKEVQRRDKNNLSFVIYERREE